MTPVNASAGVRQSADAPGRPRGTAPAATGRPQDGGRRPRRLPWLVAAAVVAAAVAGAGFAAAAGGAEDPGAPALGPGDVTVELHVEHSLFQPTEIRVVEGTRLRFVVDNDDPINHELIVGGPEVHARHAKGTEARHPSIPGEVSVGPNRMGVTTLRFDEPGTFEFACHMPGHYAYGMHGVVEVVPARDA